MPQGRAGSGPITTPRTAEQEKFPPPEYTLLVERGPLAIVERWLLRAGAFLLPLAFWWGTYDRYVIPKLLLARVLVLGLLMLLALRVIVTGSLTIKRTPLDIPLLAFVASAFVSTLLADNRNVAVFGTYSRYDGFLTILMYALLFWASVQILGAPSPSAGGQDGSVGEARVLMRVLLAAGYVVAVIAILQSVSDSIAQGVLVPAFGTLGQKNVLGAFLAMLIPLALRELVEADSWSRRILSLNAVAIIGVALLLTLSRSAWLGTALALVVLVAGGYRPNVRLGIALLAVVLVCGLIVGGLRLGGGVRAEQKVDELALSGDRPALWRDSIGLIASRPIFGYGPDNFGLVFPRFQTTYLGRQQWDKAHAETLQVAATQGLVGLAAYVFMLAAFVRAFWKGRHRDGAIAIFAAFVAYQVTLQLNFSALAASLPFWIFAAAAMASFGATPTRSRERAGVGAALIATATLAALAIIGTVFPYLADSRLRAAVAADVAGHSDAARTAAAEARDLAPRESVYAVEVGNIAFERGDWEGAASAYLDAAALGTYNPLVYRNLALAERKLSRFAEGRAAAEKAVELDRFDPANRALLAEFRSSP